VKILAVADEVDPRLYSPRLKDRYGDVDVVISCGDLPIVYLEFIVSVLNVPLVYVHGNHPQSVFAASGELKEEPEGCVNIDGRVVSVKGLLIAGLEGSMRYSDGPHQYTENEMRLKALRLVPRLLWNRYRYGRYVDILVTHAAPFGIQDANDLCHTGFRTFVTFMDRFHPRYVVHGHVHRYTPDVVSRTEYEDTTVLNVFRYQVLEFPLSG